MTSCPKSTLGGKCLVLFLVLTGFFQCLNAQLAVPFTNRLPNGNIKVKGDLVFVSNNILNDEAAPNADFNDPDLNNQNLKMAYVDIDSDPSTFSSSSASLTLPSCSQIVYAGLYWGGTYPFNDTSHQGIRDQPYESVKFKIPGGSYIDIGPTSDASFEYERIYDKDGDRDRDGSTDPGIKDVDNLGANHSPYMNYANVTQLLQTLGDNPSGQYTVANVVATLGKKPGGSLAGWTMVIIYENPNEPNRYISTYDGFAAIGKNTQATFSFDGFKTVPAPLPVNATIGVSAMEGDRTTGPQLRFRANPTDSWTQLFNTINPSSNFFNSTISYKDQYVTSRVPASENTLGWDSDIIDLLNPNNNVLPNNHTSAEVNIKTSTGDITYLFLQTIAVDIIEPEVIVEIRVEDENQNDITNAGVHLGESLDYVLTFWNRGNDDAQNLTIRDILPDHVGLGDIDLSGAPGTTMTSNPSNPQEVIFHIPDDLVPKEGSTSEIRIHVDVSSNCQDFAEACSYIIQNTAFATYAGVLNTTPITNDPSSSNVSSCGLTTLGATNFIIDDLNNCSFDKEVQICGDNVTVTAADGYTAYTWYKDVNEDGQLDANDTVYTDANTDNNPQTVVIAEVGSYLVKKESASCNTLMEHFTVTRFGATQTNPIADLINNANSNADPNDDIPGELTQCPNDGSYIPQIFLCGASDSRKLILNITDTNAITWQKLVEGSCSPGNLSCANTQSGCTWQTVGTGNSYLADTEGRYRLVLSYSGGCNNRFYFDVFKNNLDFGYNKTNIFCSTPGDVGVTKVGSSYTFQLVDNASGAILVPYSAGEGPYFPIANPGTYRVEFAQKDPNSTTNQPLPGTCEFSTPALKVTEQIVGITTSSTDASCLGNGTVRIQAKNGRANYHFSLYFDDGSGNPGTLVDNHTQSKKDYTFTDLNAGDYVAVVGTDDGCEAQEAITVNKILDPKATAVTTRNIGCSNGTIALTGTDGVPNPRYLFAIWSKNGVSPYTDVSDIPVTEFQKDTIAPGVFDFLPGNQGVYKFVIVDSNNCWSYSNEVTLLDNGPLVLNAPTVEQPIVCNGSATGRIKLSATGGEAPYTYSMDNGVTFQTGDTFSNLGAGTYDLIVRDDTGCQTTLSYTLDDPDPFTAFAGIASDASCDVNGNSLARFTNVEGGTEPYSFSFDGGANYVVDNPSDPTVRTMLLPPGSYQLIAQDANGCEVTIPLTIAAPPALPNFMVDQSYNCDGSSNVNLTADQSSYNYEYSIDTSPVQTSTTGMFSNIVPGTYTITASFSEATPPNASVLLHEDFGTGSPTTSPNTINYTYEDQMGANAEINDFEYAVTNTVIAPHALWTNPIDHTASDPNGRYLVINVGTPAVGQAIYRKSINDILPNQPIQVSIAVINMLLSGTGLDPDLYIQMRDPNTDAVIDEVNTGDIPKDNNWHVRNLVMDPGSATKLDFVIVSKKIGNNGNDLAIDDIKVEQTPKSCTQTQTLSLQVDPGNAFEANLTGYTDISCNSANDGSISFEVKNFDATAGFEYSFDGGSTWTPSTTSPVTGPSILGPGSQSVLVRKADDTSCTQTLTQNITEPTLLTLTASATIQPSCTDQIGQITAVPNGGTPSYEYALEDGSGTLIQNFPNPDGPVFKGLAPGDYRILVRDLGGCTANSALVTLNQPMDLDYSITSTACYDGGNNASIQLDIVSGNGGYLFQLNGGTWTAPTPASNTTFTFSGLSNGTYTVNVKDALGCTGTAETVIIAPNLSAQVTPTNVTNCGDGSIAILANGGDGNYVYGFAPTGTPSTSVTFGTLANFTIDNTTATANPSGFDVYVRDNGGTVPYCEWVETGTLVLPAIDWEIMATPLKPDCNGGTGTITVTVQHNGGGALTPSETGQIGPFTYVLQQGGSPIATVSLVNSDSQEFSNVSPGTYEVLVTDGLGCTVTETNIIVTDPPVLTATMETVFGGPTTCDPATGVQFMGYPTGLNGSLEFSIDFGNTWQSSDTFTGPTSGDVIYPSIRTVDGSGNTLCRLDLPRYTLNYPLDDLDITISALVINCNELEVTVQGNEGTDPYVYAYTDDPSNFDPITASWSSPAKGLADPWVWNGLIPGRTYAFYVKDFGNCIRQSTVNVNELAGVKPLLPIAFTPTAKPSCNGASDGEVVFNMALLNTYDHMEWEFYEVGNPIPLQTSGGGIPNTTSLTFNGLPEGEYYILVNQMDASNNVVCHGGSENVEIREQQPITATVNSTRDITCATPGLIRVTNINGGTAPYVFDINGPIGFTALTGVTQNPIQIPSGSPAGNYTVTVTDTYGCSSAASYSVAMNVVAGPTIDGVLVENCIGSTTINVSTSGGVGAIKYAMTAATATAPTSYSNNGGIFSNVIPGDYNIYVLDGNGCVETTSLTVQPSLQATVTAIKGIDCSPTDPDGDIAIVVQQGAGNYSYSVFNLTTSTSEQSTTPFAGNTVNYHPTTAGTYEVKVSVDATTDHEACVRTFIVVIPDKKYPQFSTYKNDVSCNGASDGSIVLSQTDTGISPLTYTLLDGGLNPIPATGYTFNAATNTFEDLAPGSYYVEATGTNSCTLLSAPISIIEPSLITIPVAAVSSQEFGCAQGNNASNAFIAIDPTQVSGGSGTYVRYQFLNNSNAVVQDGSNPRLVITDRTGGTYTVQVYDANGCMGSYSLSIAPFDELQTPTVVVDSEIDCNGGEAITITAHGSQTDSSVGPHPYSFEEVGVAGSNTTGNFTGLQVGLHTFRVTNTTTGCSVFVSHNVEAIPTMVLEVVKDTPVICFGDMGSNHLLITNYSGTFTWAAYETNNTPTNPADDIPSGNGTGTGGASGSIPLPKGTYRIEVTQSAAPFCTQNVLVTIPGPSALLAATPTELGNASCSNDQGQLSVQPTGGVAPYTIEIPSEGLIASNVGSYVFTGLADGTYSVTITDAAGCIITMPGSIAHVDPIVASITPASQMLTCIGDTNAMISAGLVSGGTGVIRYSLNTITASGSILNTSAKQTVPDFTGLGKGRYSITVTDDAGCSVTTSIAEVTEPAPLLASLTLASPLSCAQDAQFLLTASGGNPPGGIYQWSLTSTGGFTNMSGGNTHSFNGPAGTYKYYVSDGTSCVPVASNGLTEEAIPPVQLTVDDSEAIIYCNGESTAIIRVSATGGLGNYQYSLYTDAAHTGLVASNTNGVFADLSMGSYYATVDSGDCFAQSLEIPVTEPPALTVQSTKTDVSCFGASDGSITITPSGGTPGYQYAISPNLNRFGSNGTFTGLETGVYTVIVQDANGCYQVEEFTIDEPSEIIINAESEDEVCAGNADGVIRIQISGGVAPYRTSLDSNADTDYAPAQYVFNNLAAGNHVVFVKDAHDCEQYIFVEIKAGANLNATVEPVYECDGNLPTNHLSITMEDESVLPDLLYALDSSASQDLVLVPDFTDMAPGMHTLTIAHANGCMMTYDFEVVEFEPLSLSLSNEEINRIKVEASGGLPNYSYQLNGGSYTTATEFIIRETGTYQVTVTDENGCSVTENIFVEFIDVEMPNFFTPDGDGINDLWKPKNLEIFPNIKIIVFDRSGREVYRMTRETPGWDGIYNDTKLPAGDYWYVITLNDREDQREFVGHFTLYR